MMKRKRLLQSIPKDALYVRVKTAKGHEKYRPVDPRNGDFEAILDTDTIPLVSGKPVTMTKKPGRRKATPRKVTATTPLNAQLQEQKNQLVAQDRLLRNINKKISEEPDSIQLQVMRGIAEEVVSLEFEKLQAEAEGRDTSQLSLRRTNALKAIAENYGRFPEEVSKVYRSRIEKLETKLSHIEATLDLLLTEMATGEHPTGISLTKMWPPILLSILDEIRTPS